jgi:ribosomal protein RSM22 (predicted rRNA methylase)
LLLDAEAAERRPEGHVENENGDRGGSMPWCHFEKHLSSPQFSDVFTSVLRVAHGTVEIPDTI